MKRFGILLLLAAMVLGQVSWALTPSATLAQDDVQAADAAQTETAVANAAETAAADAALTAQAAAQETAAADQATQAAQSAQQTAVSAAQTAAAIPSATNPALPSATQIPAASNTPSSGGQPGATTASTYKNIDPGDTVRITTTSLNVRGTTSTATPVVATVIRGDTFLVLEGPIRINNYDWIRIDMSTPPSDPRWIAAQFVELVSGPAAADASTTPDPSITPDPSVSPTNTLTAQPSPTATPYKSIQPGDSVRITSTSVNVRGTASPTGPIVGEVVRNQVYPVLDGPVRAGNYDWIQIDISALGGSANVGWIAAQFVLRIAPQASATPTSTPDGSATPTSTPNGSVTATSTATATRTPNSTVVAGTFRPGDQFVVRSSLNVRSGAGTNYGIVKVANRGEQGTVLSNHTIAGSYTWVQVRLGSVTGWLVINYIQHLSMTTPTVTPPVWLLSVSIDCYSSPERITIVNSASVAAQILSITTHFDAGANEPFVLNQSLSAKTTRAYTAGTGASGSFRLTTGFIFTNSAGSSEGVTVETTWGTISRSCPTSSSGERWVQIDLSEQYMTVYQGSVRVSGTYVSTGKPGFDTPRGTYRTFVKYLSTRMTACSNGECWDTPNVPFTHYFTNGGHALHGAYWHNDFGRVRSHGCVNLPVPFSEWLYYWLPLGARVVIVA